MKKIRIIIVLILIILLIMPLLALGDANAKTLYKDNSFLNKSSNMQLLNNKKKEINKSKNNDSVEKLKQDENLLVLGVSGLRLEDVMAGLKYYNFENLKTFIENSALANNIVRSSTSASCTADGWLALNTGKRISDVYRGGNGICADFKAPYDSGRFHDWKAYEYSESINNYHAELGTLKDVLKEYKIKTIGLGAGLALSNSDGKVTNFINSNSNNHILAKDIKKSLEDNKLVVVDAGQIRPYQSLNVRAYRTDSFIMSKERGRIQRRQYTQEKMLKRGGQDYLDTRLAYKTYELLKRLDTVLSYQDRNQNIILTSLADSGPIPHLQFTALKGPVFKQKGFIRSSSTRQIGLIQNEDIHKKIISLLGQSQIDPLTIVASNLPTFTKEDLIANMPQSYEGSIVNVLIDRAVHADRIKRTAPVFLIYMVGITAILFAVVGLLLNKNVIRLVKRFSGKDFSRIATSVLTWKILRFVSIMVACIPICGLIYNLLPWWQYRTQQVGTIVISTLMAMIIASICSIGKIKNSLSLPLIIVSLIHIVALTIDPLNNNRMLLDSVLGSQSLLGARMYGFGNIMFALFASSTLMFAAALCERFVFRKSKWVIFVIIFAMMIFATAIDGLPKFGADFGGPPAIIPGFIFLMLILLGIKLSWKRIITVFFATGLVVSSIAIFDWIRPATQRTHLGNLIQIILDGGLWPVVYRKLGANVHMLTSPLIVIAIGGVILITYIIFYPHMKKNIDKNIDTYRWIINDYTDNHVGNALKILKPMIISLSVMLFIGGSVNVSGIVIPGNAIILIVPMCLSIWFTWMINVRMQNSSIDCKINV